MFGQRNLREIDGRQCRPVVAVLDQLAGHLDADIRLRLFACCRRRAGVRITLSNSRSGETNWSPAPFGSAGKTSSAAPPTCFRQRRGQRVDIHHFAARGVDQFRSRLHARQLQPRRSFLRSPEFPARAASSRRQSASSSSSERDRARVARATAWSRYRNRTPACPPIRPARRSAFRYGRIRRCRASCRGLRARRPRS